MPIYSRPLKGFRYVNGQRTRMTELEELRFLAKFSTKPNSTPYQRNLGRWAIEEIRTKYSGKGLFGPNRGE